MRISTGYWKMRSTCACPTRSTGIPVCRIDQMPNRSVVTDIALKDRWRDFIEKSMIKEKMVRRPPTMMRNAEVRNAGIIERNVCSRYVPVSPILMS